MYKKKVGFKTESHEPHQGFNPPAGEGKARMGFNSLGGKARMGFTFIEVMMVIGISALMISLLSINLIRPQLQASVTTATSTLIADVRSQQLKAMLGEVDASGSPVTFGVYFSTDSYTLFKGVVYNPNDSANSVVNLPSGISFNNINLTNSQVIFSRVSGEVVGYSDDQNSVSLIQTQNNTQVNLSINQLGVLNQN